MRTRRLVTPLAVVAALALSCGEPTVPASVEVTAIRQDVLPADPGDAVWTVAPVYTAKLLRQDVVEPRLLEASTSEVRVQAISNGRRLALRLA